MSPLKPLKPADLYAIIYPTLVAMKVDYAVGGAVAMAAHGYVRDTTDLDVFFKYEDANKVLGAFRKKFQVATLADPVHFAIFPDLRDPDVRVDLLFTSFDLERDAVESPDEALIVTPAKTFKAAVFPLDVLVAAKLVSDRSRDHGDVVRMYERGLFDPARVKAVLKQNDEKDGLKMLRDIFASKRGPTKRRRR